MLFVTKESCETADIKLFRARSIPGKGYGGACEALELCYASTFSWDRFPYFGVLLLIVLICAQIMLGSFIFEKWKLRKNKK